jgi:two-component system sensor histidine kinase AtoS
MKHPPAALERQVLDALPITIYTVDLAGRITFLNRPGTGAPALCDERAELGASLWDAITDATAREQVQQAMESLRTGRAGSLSWELPCSSQTGQRIFLVQVSALGDGQSVHGFVLSTVDITPSHRSRELLVHKRRLAAIGEVSAGVAHELRNPLFGISSAAQLLRFRVKDDPVVEKNVGRILREVERLNNMVTALLEFGRPGPITLARGNPDAVWDEVLEHQRGLLESRALLIQRTRAEPPVHCAIDPQQLAQLCLNLLLNATDAAPEGSDLTLHSSVLPNGAWRCRLHNGGAAIPPEVLPRVFEIFFSTKPGGTGIGLALCQRIIDEHGGTIALESAPGCGTDVTITLPPVGIQSGGR